MHGRIELRAKTLVTQQVKQSRIQNDGVREALGTPPHPFDKSLRLGLVSGTAVVY